MSKEEDRQFFDTFTMVLGALVVFSIFVYILANVIGDRTQSRYVDENPLKADLVAERLSPVAQVAIAGQAPPPSSTAMPVSAPVGGDVAGGPDVTMTMAETPLAEPAAEVDGKAVYDSACFACHAAGIAGAPRFADTDAWAPRIAKGLDTLYANSINGYQGDAGVMPAKGGRTDLSDAQVRAAVDYMVAAAQ